MGLTYYLVPLLFQREFYARALCRLQPWLFGGGISLAAVGMSFAGSYGVPRRHWDVDFSGAQFAVGFDSGAHVMLGLLGVGAVIAFLGLLAFILLVVAAVFFGRSNAGRPMEAWHAERRVRERLQAQTVDEEGGHRTPGTMVLALVFLASFAVYYFANWLWLSDVWHVR
jgi:cytochrome c oxidase subunit 1